MKQELLRALNKNRAGSRPVAVATLLDTGEQWLIDNESDGGAEKKITALARGAMAEDKSQVVEFGSSTLFLQVHSPPLRMVIVGAVHIAQSLSVMAADAGYDVTVIAPRLQVCRTGGEGRTD